MGAPAKAVPPDLMDACPIGIDSTIKTRANRMNRDFRRARTKYDIVSSRPKVDAMTRPGAQTRLERGQHAPRSYKRQSYAAAPQPSAARAYLACALLRKGDIVKSDHRPKGAAPV